MVGYTSSFLPTTEKCSVARWVSIPSLGSEGPQQLSGAVVTKRGRACYRIVIGFRNPTAAAG